MSPKEVVDLTRIFNWMQRYDGTCDEHGCIPREAKCDCDFCRLWRRAKETLEAYV